MNSVHPLIFIGVVLTAGVALSRLVQITVRSIVEVRARRSREGRSDAWITRLPRADSSNTAEDEIRRDQRVSATATLLSRIANTLLAIGAVVVILMRLDVDIAWLVGSAGFLGMSLAISGQYSMQDFINGLHVLLEDRFFIGDVIEIGTSDERTIGTVERVGMFATRLRDGEVTVHVANRELVHIRNRSQRGHSIHLELPMTADVGEERLCDAMRDALHQVHPEKPAGIIVERLTASTNGGVSVDARLGIALDTQQHRELARRVRNQLEFDD